MKCLVGKTTNSINFQHFLPAQMKTKQNKTKIENSRKCSMEINQKNEKNETEKFYFTLSMLK